MLAFDALALDAIGIANTSTADAPSGGTTSVSADLALDYSLLARVDADLALDYSLLARINADLALDYSIVGRVDADIIFTYSIGGIVSFTPSAARTIRVGAANLAFSADAPGFWNLTNPKAPYGLKDPNSTIDINFDWTEWLADISDSAAFFSWTLTGGLTKVAVSVSGPMASIFVSDGTLLADAQITCEITTSSTPPRVEDRTIILKIEER